MDAHYTSTQYRQANPPFYVKFALRIINALLTGRLWWMLLTPPVMHPLFQQLINERNRHAWQKIRLGIWVIIGLMTLLLLGTVPIMLFLILFIGPLVYAILNTVIYCALWCMDITGTFTRQFIQKTADLHALFPVGALGAVWIIFSARLHENNYLQRSLDEILGVMQWLFFIMLFLIIGIIVTPSGNEQSQLILIFVSVITLMLFFYLDHIQSVLCCLCISILTARHTRTVGDARLWTVVTFLAVQSGWYIGILLMISLVIPAVIVQFDLWSFELGLILPGLLLCSVFMLKELFIRHLWRRVLYQTNSDAQDLHLLAPYV